VGSLGLGELLKILGLSYNISATAGASDFKFGMNLVFQRHTIKPHLEEKWAWPWAMFPFNISATAALTELLVIFLS